MNPDQKIEWLISSGSFNDLAVHPETYDLIQKVYPRVATETRQRLIQVIRDAVKRDQKTTNSKEGSDRELYDRFYILLRADPDCELVQTEFNNLQSRYPEWEPQEAPDLLFHFEAYYPRYISPWSVELLLSRPGGEWVDEILGYLPPGWSEPIDGVMDEKHASQGVLEATTRNARWGIELANELVNRSEWSPDLWRALIDAWQEAELDAQQFLEILTIVRSDEVLDTDTSRRSIADLLYCLVKDGGKPYAVRLLPECKDVARTIWDRSEDDIPGPQAQNDWLTLAINMNAGMIVRFWLSALWIQSERGTKRDVQFQEDDREFFELVVNDVGVRGKCGRAMLTARMSYLLSFDYEWTTQRLLPLFDPSHRSFVPAWHGFTWEQLRPDVSELMKPMFLSAVNNIEKLGCLGVPGRREAFMRQYAMMMAYAVDKPLERWVPALFRNGADQDRLTFAREIGRILRNMADAQKIELWNRWLKRYWQNRVDGMPDPLHQSEIKEMLSWPAYLEVVFQDAVALAIEMPSKELEHPRVSKFLFDEELARRFPQVVAQLIEYIDEVAKNAGDWYAFEPLINVLLQSQLEGPLKNTVKDIQVRHASAVSV